MVEGIILSPRTSFFKIERENLEKYLEEKRSSIDGNVEAILDTLLELITRFPDEVKAFDLKRLNDFLFKKANTFYNRFKEEPGLDTVSIEKNIVYFYRFCSISLFYKSRIILYPHMLVCVANYQNFIKLMCKKLRMSRPQVNLIDFLDTVIELLSRCKPKLEKRDVRLVVELSKSNFSLTPREFYTKIRFYESKKRYQRLVNLGIIALYYSINFPSLGLVPYMHLSLSHVEIPSRMKPHIEYEYHPARTKHEYQIFRLILIPDNEESEWVPVLRELGLTGKVNEWYMNYNWDSLYQTTEQTWKWNLDSLDMKTKNAKNRGTFDLFLAKQSERFTSSFIAYLEAIHRLRVLNDSDLSAETGIKVNTIVKYRKKAMKNKFILPIWDISRIGIDNHYQVCFRNSEKNHHLASFLDILPKVVVIKSREFSRYMICLSAHAITKINRLLKAGIENNEVEILWRKHVLINDKTIMRGVNLIDVCSDRRRVNHL